MARGSEKWRGLSPWNNPFDVAFMAAGHALAFVAIFYFAAKSNYAEVLTSVPALCDSHISDSRNLYKSNWRRLND